MLAKSAELWPMVRAISDGRQVTCCWRPLIVTAIFTGMRASEVRGLGWDAFDVEAGVLHVRQRADRYNRLGPPKSRAGRRDIPLAPMVKNALREWKLLCPKSKQGLVFPNEQGEPLWHTNLYIQCFQKLLSACGLVVKKEESSVASESIENSAALQHGLYNFHSLRHAAASLFIEQGWSPKKVQMVMGHSSIQVTFDVYGHLFPDQQEDAKAMIAIENRLLQAQ